MAGNLSSDRFRITLSDVNPEICEAWRSAFEDVDSVRILLGSITDVDVDAIVSAANSFGDLSGGVDKHIDDFFEGRAQRLLVPEIRERYFGEMPVGCAIILPIRGARIPYLISAPTMRTPSSVAATINAYLAFRAVLVAVQQHNEKQTEAPITHIAVPGLCTGIGAMPYEQSAVQMRAAIDNKVEGRGESITHPATAPFPTGSALGKQWRWE